MSGNGDGEPQETRRQHKTRDYGGPKRRGRSLTSGPIPEPTGNTE